MYTTAKEIVTDIISKYQRSSDQQLIEEALKYRASRASDAIDRNCVVHCSRTASAGNLTSPGTTLEELYREFNKQEKYFDTFNIHYLAKDNETLEIIAKKVLEIENETECKKLFYKLNQDYWKHRQCEKKIELLKRRQADHNGKEPVLTREEEEEFKRQEALSRRSKFEKNTFILVPKFRCEKTCKYLPTWNYEQNYCNSRDSGFRVYRDDGHYKSIQDRSDARGMTAVSCPTCGFDTHLICTDLEYWSEEVKPGQFKVYPLDKDNKWKCAACSTPAGYKVKKEVTKKAALWHKPTYLIKKIKVKKGRGADAATEHVKLLENNRMSSKSLGIGSNTNPCGLTIDIFGNPLDPENAKAVCNKILNALDQKHDKDNVEYYNAMIDHYNASIVGASHGSNADINLAHNMDETFDKDDSVESESMCNALSPIESHIREEKKNQQQSPSKIVRVTIESEEDSSNDDDDDDCKSIVNADKEFTTPCEKSIRNLNTTIYPTHIEAEDAAVTTAENFKLCREDNSYAAPAENITTNPLSIEATSKDAENQLLESCGVNTISNAAYRAKNEDKSGKTPSPWQTIANPKDFFSLMSAFVCFREGGKNKMKNK